MGQAGHYQPAFRLRDRKPGSSEVLGPSDEGDMSTLPDVDFRIDAEAGRVVWTVDDLIEKYCPFLSGEERDLIMGGTATRILKLQQRPRGLPVT